MKNFQGLTQQHLKRNPDKLKKFNKVCIWSGEHQAWWRANACGYTDDFKEAGIYDISTAWQKVSHCGSEKKIKIINIKGH